MPVRIRPRHEEAQLLEPRRAPAPVEHELYEEHTAKLLRAVGARVDT